MMTIKTVALLGAGAVGCYFIPGLTEMMGDDFCVVAEGDRRERLLRDGLIINDRQIKPNVKTPEEAAGPDLLIISTKYDGLRSAFPAIRTIVRENTTVISALNGIDSEELLAQEIGEEHLLNAFMFIASARKGNSVRYDPVRTKGLVIGAKDPTPEDYEREEAIRELLTRAGIKCRVSREILREQWQKFVLNIGNNLPQAVFGVGLGAYIDSEHMRAIHDRLYAEVMEVAKAYGIELEYVEVKRGQTPDNARFSTLQDLDAKRHTEIEMFAGVLMQKAREKGIEVPFTEYTYHAIKILEEKNDGRFDYD